MQMIYICLKSQIMTVTMMVQVFFIIFKNKNSSINKQLILSLEKLFHHISEFLILAKSIFHNV